MKTLKNAQIILDKFKLFFEELPSAKKLIRTANRYDESTDKDIKK